MNAYLIDEGVLLSPEDEEFEAYSQVYNNLYGFYDEGQYYETNKLVAIANARKYVEAGVERTYAIVSITWLPDNFDFEDGYVEDETYQTEDVVYSVAKIDGEIVEDFLSRPNLFSTQNKKMLTTQTFQHQESPNENYFEELNDYLDETMAR